MVKNLLEKIGIKANLIFTDADGVEKLKQIPQAEYNLVLSTWNGHRIAKKLEEKFKTPFITFPGVPIGPKQTSNFLRTVGKKIGVDSAKVEEVIDVEERRAYRFIEYSGDAILIARPHSYFAVVAGSNTAIGVTQFLVNEMGYLPDIIQLTDNPQKNKGQVSSKNLLKNLKQLHGQI